MSVPKGFTMAQSWRLDLATASRPLDGKPSDTLIQFNDRQFEIDVLARGK